MAQKKRKVILPGATLVLSFYLSFLFGIGILIGFLISTIIIKGIEQDLFKRIFIGFGEWKLHLHHWMIGIIILFVFISIGWFPVHSKVFLGGICGLVLHEFYFDNDWFEIILKRTS